MVSRVPSLLTKIPVYPLLFGIYPVLYLWGANRSQESAYVVIPSLLATFALVSLAYLLAGFLFRDTHRAAGAVFLLSIFVLGYGHAVNLLASLHIIVHYRWMPVGLALTLLLTFLLVRRFDFKRPAEILNPVSVILVLLAVIPTGYFYVVSAHRKVAAPLPISAQIGSSSLPQADRPDVYFILLDAYSRSDLFQSRFDFDNRAFVSALTARGFVFPDCAKANYPATTPVIASILNMDYLNDLRLSHSAVLNEAGSAQLGPYIQDNRVFQSFRSHGYRLVTFRGFLPLIDLQNVDRYVDFEQDVSFTRRLETNNFQDLYLRTTALSGYQTALQILSARAPEQLQKYLPADRRFEQVRQQNIYALQALQAMPASVEGPKLVYAHLYAAHWPYALRPDGSARLPYTEAETDAGYLDGVRYLNNHLLDVIDSILANSKTPPVIILQSDHGYPEQEGKPDWSGANRLKIFSAYYLPGGGDLLLYDQITPVNNFRLVLKQYLHEDISLLPDASYYVRPDNGAVEVAPSTCISR